MIAAMKIVKEQAIRRHINALIRRRITYAVWFPVPPLQFLPNKLGLQDLLFERMKTLPWTAVQSEAEYDEWFINIVKEDSWRPFSKDIERDRWGVFAKLLNIVIYELMWCREVADEAQWIRIRPWLHVPLDRFVMEDLHKKDPLLFPSDSWSLSGVSEEKYMKAQRAVRKLAGHRGVLPISFEDAWSWNASQDTPE